LLATLLARLSTMKHGSEPRIEGDEMITLFFQFCWFHGPFQPGMLAALAPSRAVRQLRL